jgi:hypothetical protein
MAPILKRLRKPLEPSPDLATLLQPYGARNAEGSDDPDDARGSEPAAHEEDS